ncbi:hypothetical protein M5K25_009299 [Dendrobium thyrsiflorum]|uniref:Uncharacterized protein n=1 Tax=Dendrobium thyrsiflorum TaxID=117978 RepID=A0ABD0VC52_DENTH
MAEAGKDHNLIGELFGSLEVFLIEAFHRHGAAVTEHCAEAAIANFHGGVKGVGGFVELFVGEDLGLARVVGVIESFVEEWRSGNGGMQIQEKKHDAITTLIRLPSQLLRHSQEESPATPLQLLEAANSQLKQSFCFVHSGENPAAIKAVSPPSSPPPMESFQWNSGLLL